jgi:hypothetical protein
MSITTLEDVFLNINKEMDFDADESGSVKAIES